MAPILIDNEAKLQTLLQIISDHVCTGQNLDRSHNHDQLIFVDLEGVNLSRHGQIAIIQLLMPPSPVVYLVDVHTLQATTFDFEIENGTSLRSILESSTVFKVFFDIRNDSDALHALFGINVAGVIDLQLIEYATRNPRGKFVNGMAKCIEHDLHTNIGWSQVKANGRRLFVPELGGQYEVFLKRPLAPELVKYCEQDVLLMPQLLALYGRKLDSRVAAQLQGIVDERISLSKTAMFNGQGRHMAIGPSLRPAREYSNIAVSPEMGLVVSDRLEHLCHLTDGHLDPLLVQLGVPHA